MKKSAIKECISLKNNQKKIDKDFFNNQLLNDNKSSSLRTLFLKFKTQKTSPKRVSQLTIKNKSLNKGNISNKKVKKENNNQIIKVISKNGSMLIKKKLNILNNTSYENHRIKFRNQLVHNNRYTPKSFENVISINLNKNDNDFLNKNKNNKNMEKYKSSNIINIKRKNKKSDVIEQDKKIKKKIKIIRANDLINHNFNNLKNNTLKDYIMNFSSSNRSHNNCMTRINSNKIYECINLSCNHLNNKHKKDDFNIKLNYIKNSIYKKINNQTTPVTMNISRNFSSKKKISNKNGKKSLLLTSNNSKIINKIQNKKSSFLSNHQNIKFIKNNIIEDNKNKLNNDEIKVLKPNKKKKKIILINKNNSNSYKYNDKNPNFSSKYKENKSALLFKREEKCNINYDHIQKLLTENKEPIIYKINYIKNDKNINNNIIDNNKNNAKIMKKKISISNTKTKNSKNNSIQKNQIHKNKTITNKKMIIKTCEKQKSSQKIQNRKLLIKSFINKKRTNMIHNNNKNNAFINKINKINKNKKSSERILNIFPHIKKNFKDKKYTLTCNSRIITPHINIVNNSCIHDIKKNKTRIEDNNSKNKIVVNHDIDSHKKIEKMSNNSIDNIKDDNVSQNNKDFTKKCMYFSEESQKLSKYIKDYYILNNDYPSSNIGFYKFGRIIGKGAFGKVNIGLHILTGRIVAIKSFNKEKFKDEKSRNKIMNEIELMKNLKHFSVVRILDIIETDKYILLVMENVLGGDLLTFIKKRNKLNEKTAKFIFKQLLQSLKYIHSKNIVHRDIKLDNILIDLNNNIKLCDFGVGKYLVNNNEILFDQCGTPAYIAPEVMAGEGYIGFPVDLWSSGVVLYSLLMGSIPFKAQNLNELQGLIMSGNFKQVNGISKNANDLLNKLLEINPKKRINVDEALNHPWLCENNDDDNYKDSLFTKAEIILLSKNNADYRSCTNEEIIENFTLENLDTNKFNENKNSKTKTYIFAPFNTSYNSNEVNFDNDNLNNYNLEKGLIIQNNIILFDQDTNALNRQYELNNNIEIDHGVIINNTKETNNNINNSKKDLKINDDNSNNYNLNSEKNKSNSNEENDNYNSELYLKVIKNNFKSEKESENLININNSKISYDSNRNKFNNINSIQTYPSTMILDENVIKNMENFGYNKEYIQKCIFNNDVNYCHATYYLLLNSSDLYC